MLQIPSHLLERERYEFQIANYSAQLPYSAGFTLPMAQWTTANAGDVGLVREDPKWRTTTTEPVHSRAVAITRVPGPPKLNPKQNLVLCSI